MRLFEFHSLVPSVKWPSISNLLRWLQLIYIDQIIFWVCLTLWNHLNYCCPCWKLEENYIFSLYAFFGHHMKKLWNFKVLKIVVAKINPTLFYLQHLYFKQESRLDNFANKSHLGEVALPKNPRNHHIPKRCALTLPIKLLEYFIFQCQIF